MRHFYYWARDLNPDSPYAALILFWVAIVGFMALVAVVIVTVRLLLNGYVLHVAAFWVIAPLVALYVGYLFQKGDKT